MKRSLLLAPLLLALAACGQSTEPGVPAPPSPTVSVSTTAAPPTTTAPPPAAATEIAEPSPAPDEAAADEAAADEPVVIECLEDGAGTAVWSDGTTRLSDWCREIEDGPAQSAVQSTVAQAPPRITGTTSQRGYSCSGDAGCFWPDGSPVAGADRCGVTCGEAPTSGEMQLKNGCEGGYITQPGLCDDPWWE